MSGESILVNERVSRVRTRWPVQLNLRFVSWIPVAIAFAVTGLLMLYDGGSQASVVAWRARLVENIAPLIAALQAAFVFSPEDEAALEVMLACPRSIVWVLLERLAMLLMLFTGVALAWSAVSLGLNGDNNVLLAIVRWLSPMVFLIGISLVSTLIARQPALGLVMTIVTWFGMNIVGDALLDQFPWLWPLHAYLQPEALKLTYALNRIALIAIGAGLIGMAIHQLRDEEHVLLGSQGAKWITSLKKKVMK
jgi:hypothetical protein